MDTPFKVILTKSQALLAGALLLLLPAVALAGSLGNLAGTLTLHRATGTPRAAAVSLAGLPMLRVAGAQRPQMPLDTPRAGALNLHQEAPAASESAAAAALHSPQGLHFEDASATVNPRLVHLARNFHHEGLPVVKLWQADRNMVSIGLNTRGVPGIFFTQSMGK